MIEQGGMFSKPDVVPSPEVEPEARIERRTPRTMQALDLIQEAVAGRADVAVIEKLVDLQDRMQRRSAELEFAEALAAFQDECPAIPRSSKAEIIMKSGGKFGYIYADFEQIVETARPHLRKHGLSFSFDSRVDDKGMLTATGTLRHVNGHSIASNFTLPTSSASAMSDQQRFGAALTFAKRQVLISVLGLSLTDPDPENEIDPTKIDEAQCATILALIDETQANIFKFLEHFSIEAVDGLLASDYRKAIAMLERKRGRA